MGNEQDRPMVTPEEMVLRLRGVTRGIQDFLAAEAKEHGLTSTEFVALIRTADGDRMTGAHLAHALGMRSSSVTGLADRLEARGLITRRAHPSDRRSVVLQATRSGRAVVNRALGPLLEQLLRVARELESDERAAVAACLERIDDVLRRPEPPSSSAPRPRTQGQRD
ncbi:MAG: MarR family transcriptional regulator [Solirubrobacterales bacterium]|nr:MarR family transcriptional regulator [Solirubrobacterales bacterium]